MENNLSKVNLPDFMREAEYREQLKVKISNTLTDCLYFGIVDQVNWDKIDKAVEQIRLGGR